jgi:Tetratricopeptide repeat
MHGLVQWRARKYEKDRPWDLWYTIFITAVCHQIVEDPKEPHYRRHIILHIPEGSELKLDVSEADEIQKLFIGSTIGRVYDKERRWKEAEKLQVQVMEMSTRMLGTKHPDTLSSMGNLASTYRDQGRWRMAETLEVQVMETSKRVLGTEHPSTLTSKANLAATYRNQGRWQETEELDVQVLETRKRVLGDEHPDSLDSMDDLASTFQDQGRWKEAEELFVQVMEMRKRVLGKEHPDMLISMGNSSAVLLSPWTGPLILVS